MNLRSLFLPIAFAASFVTIGAVNPPKANILDVEFNSDGSATDLSPLETAVQRKGEEKVFTYYNPVYDCYLAHFENEFGGQGTTSFYRIDYEAITKFYNALAQSNTLEALVMCDYTSMSPDIEYKPFSSMEGGGIGFLTCTASRGLKKTNEFTFLPYASNGWTWCISGVHPQPRKYYHLVGVYDKEARKARVYVNGELCNEVSAPAELKYPAAGCRWFCIGGDPGSTGGQSLWRGDVGMTRIYDRALSTAEVEALWTRVHDRELAAAEHTFLTDISYVSQFPIVRGSEYEIQATGFEEGDYLIIVDPHQDQAEVVNGPAKITSKGASIRLPEAMLPGYYALYACRDGFDQFLGIAQINFIDKEVKGAEVIAHRGFWNATAQKAQNSVEALNAALDAGFYGSELDIWITTDGRLVVNHDGVHNGVTIENSNYETTVKNLKLSNGEYIPTFDDFLDALERKPASPTKLIIEVKTHTVGSRTLAAATKAVEMVKARNLQSRVEYISFSIDACRQIRSLDPTAKIAFLSGSLAPSALVNDRIDLDYNSSVLTSNPGWIAQAHQNGLTVNVWTVNARESMIEFTSQGVDFITTDNPDVALEVKNTFDKLSSIDEIIADQNDENAAEEYYNLQGVRVNKPAAGNIYIVRRGSKVTKQLVM